MMRKRILLRLSEVTAQMTRDRMKLQGRECYGPSPYQGAWAVVVLYKDGEQKQLPLGVKDEPA